MLIALLIGAAGLAADAIAFINRNGFSDKSRARQFAPYIAFAVLAIGVAAAVAAIVSSQTGICGPAGDGSRCS